MCESRMSFCLNLRFLKARKMSRKRFKTTTLSWHMALLFLLSPRNTTQVFQSPYLLSHVHASILTYASCRFTRCQSLYASFGRLRFVCYRFFIFGALIIMQVRFRSIGFVIEFPDFYEPVVVCRLDAVRITLFR